MKKGILSVFAVTLSTLGFMMGVSAAETLPAPVDGKITLTEDVTLLKEFKVNKGENITIDLAGHTLNGPANSKPGTTEGGYDGYAINNYYGNLTIMDSSAKKSNIICPSDDSSCIRNYGTLNINGVTVKSNFIGVKNEEDSTLKIENSVVYSDGKSSSIQNYGTATVSNSEISTGNNSVAIFALTYKDYSSKITINNSKVDSKRAIYTSYDKGSDKSDTASSSIIINGGSFSKDATIVFDEDSTSSSVNINGNVTGPVAILPYAQSGATITLTNLGDKVIVPNGVNVKTIDGMEVVSNEDGTISVVEKQEGDENEPVIEPTTTTQADEKNPNTSDNAGLYFALGLIGLFAAGVTTRSLIKHH